MDLSFYERRLGAISSSEALIRDSVAIVNEDFNKAPSYRRIQINGENDECTFKHTKDSNKLELFFRPLKILDKGMYVLLNERKYMIVDFTPNEIYPKAEIKLCNNTLRWRDDFDNLKECDCIITGSNYKVADATGNEKFIMSSDAELVVQVQYNDDTKLIRPNDRFIFGEHAYDVAEIDSLSNVYNGKGFINLVVKATELTSTDDTSTGVADESGNSSWGDW